MDTRHFQRCTASVGAILLIELALLALPALSQIQPASGEVQWSETDWMDASPHGLDFRRHYRSQATHGAGLGTPWNHNWGATAAKGDLEAVVRFGDGSKVIFRRAGGTEQFVADNRRDSLAQNDAGLLYTSASDESSWQFDLGGRLISLKQRNGWQYILTYNSQGQLATVSNAFGRSLHLAYSGTSLVSARAPDSEAIAYGYDGVGRLAGVVYPDGAARQYHYEDSRFAQALTGVSDEAGARAASYGYDSAGRAVASQGPGGVGAMSYAYPQAAAAGGTLVAGAAVDASIYRTSAQITDALGNTRNLTWQGGDGQARLLAADRAGDDAPIASRSFTGANLPDSETDFMNVVTQYSWDSTRQLRTGITKAAGRPEAQAVQLQWHPSFRLPMLITEANRTTAYTYDAQGRKLTEVITDTANAEARTWAWTWTTLGLPETMTDPKGGVWRYGYDAMGNRSSVINPLNQQSRYTYDAAGRMLTQTEGNGLKTSYTYDRRGRLLTQSRGAETSTLSYTPTGQHATVVLPSGYQVTFSYDAAQRLVEASDNRGTQITYTLDAAGNRVREEVKDGTGAIGLVVGRAMNQLGKVAAIQGSAGQTTAIAYDANAEPIARTDPLNHTTRQTLDGLRRPVTTFFADNTSSVLAWGQLDALTGVADPKGVRTSYQTNAFGEVMLETSPDIGNLSYTRDPSGDITGQTDAKGNTTTIIRDSLARPIEIRHGPGHIASFSYDSSQIGYLQSIEDKSGRTALERDKQGRILTKSQWVNDNPSSPSIFKVNYVYANGELVGLTYPSGLKVFYRRAVGRITDIDVQEPGRSKHVVPWVSGLTYTALGQPKAWRWSSGDNAARTFDADGRMTGNEFASYTHDAAGRIISITQSLWASSIARGPANVYATPLAWSVGYDNRNRLTSFSRAGAATSYAYDANSNRLTAVDKVTSDTDLDGEFDDADYSQSTSQVLNIDQTSNKLLGFSQTLVKVRGGRTVSTVSTQVNHTLDANGAMTSDGLRELEYDASGRLSKLRVVKDGGAAGISYLHNALGQRVFKGELQAERTVPSADHLGPDFIAWLKKKFAWLFMQAPENTSLGTAYVYDEEANLLGEYDNGSAKGAGRTEYIWLPTDSGHVMPIGFYRNGKFFAIHADHLGTPRLVTNEANSPVWQWPYSAFGPNKPTGVLRATPNPKAAVTNNPVLLKATDAMEFNLRFPGQYFDVESNLSYNYFRSYDAKNGRYTQLDPIGLKGGLNRLTYSGSAPLSNTDPLGLAYFAFRPLSKLAPFMLLTGTLFTWQLAHELVIYEDGGFPTNQGFSADGVTPDPFPIGYVTADGSYNDCVMRMAVSRNMWAGSGYSFLCHNCQNWANAVRKTYNELSANPAVIEKCGCDAASPAANRTVPSFFSPAPVFDLPSSPRIRLARSYFRDHFAEFDFDGQV